MQGNDSAAAPKAVSVLVTTPTAQRECDATAVEIHQSALSCPDIERTLAQDKREQRVALSGIPLLQADPSLRYVLLPAPTNGCIVVGVRTLYGKKGRTPGGGRGLAQPGTARRRSHRGDR